MSRASASDPTTGDRPIPRRRQIIGVVWSDFGGVLTPPVMHAAESVAAASGVSWRELAEAAEQVAGEFGLTGLGPLELGILTQREWADRLTACLTTTPRIDLGQWDEHWYADRPVDRGLLGRLRRIAGHGVPVGLLTNSVAEWEPHRARLLAGQEFFAATVKSHEIRLAKPDPAIFRYADAVLRPPAGQRALLIDDHPANCAAAEDHGWLAIHHRSAGDTIARLHRMRFAAAQHDLPS